MDSDDDAPLIAKVPRLQNAAQTAKSTAREKSGKTNTREHAISSSS